MDRLVKRGGNAIGAGKALWALVMGALFVVAAGAASGASITKAEFTAGGVVVDGVRYAKQGEQLTLTVTTSSDAKCVAVGSFATRQISATGKSSWTFTANAPAGDGVKSFTVTVGEGSNNNGCTTRTATGAASYVLDNTGPVVTGTVTPTPNTAGWNNSNATVTWGATDAGSGVATVSPATGSVTANTSNEVLKATGTDRLGNSAEGSVTVKLDKSAPSIRAAASPAPNAAGWNSTDVTVSFVCDDSQNGASGLKSCPAPVLRTTSGTVSGTATDVADNTATASVDVKIDRVAPTLSGKPATSPNGDGWYNGDVSIAWTAVETGSGLVGGAPADSVIAGEGSGLTATKTVRDNAGHETTATSAPAVNIDRTAPVTFPTAPVSDWNNANVAVQLAAFDALSGLNATRYSVNNGAEQTGTSVAFSAEGVHTLRFWSEDKAGNVEPFKTIQVKIDKTTPSINHTFSTPANANGWHKADVTVTFICEDSLSGIASCTAPQKVTTEGKDQAVTGTATDKAGNTATDPVKVSLDRTAPTIRAAADREPNANGWYNDEVVVTFTCRDELSGTDVCPPAKTLGEGANQTASGTITDAAGNAASASLTGIDVDKTAPTLNGAATTAPNANGWYRGDVSVAWDCGDALSGLAGACPTASTITGEGSALSASAAVSDKAGNSTSKTVGGIKIDRTAPSTFAEVPAPLASGWYAGAVRVELRAVDGLSGADTTYYSIDGGAAQTYTGAFSHATKGKHTITFWSVDHAGNVEDKARTSQTITLKIDGVPPRINGSRLTAANGSGWNNGPVTVGFDCTDEESGIAACTGDTTVVNEGANQSVRGDAEDNAGNTASTTVGGINIDLTAPVLGGEATTQPNAAGWYRGDVIIAWGATDGLSGVNPATQPANSTITGEGAELGAGPVTVEDKAGNVSLPASVSGIKIDRTAPVINGGPTTQPNANGWYKGDVVVDFSCTDALSGVAACPTSKVLTGNGANQSVTSDPAGDFAGNTAAGKTVGGISIDGVAPQTSADNRCDGSNGYCRGQKATVTLTAADQPGLSGVAEIRYSVNGGPEKSSTDNPAVVDVPLAAKSGLATVTFAAVDKAGNVEPAGGVSLKYDNIAPTVTNTLNPTANANGWNKANTTVHFDAKDDDGGSGVDITSVTPDVLVDTETAGQVVNGKANDLAGNEGTDSVTVKLDKTAPRVTGAATTSPNTNGWYSGPVTVSFNCSDALSTVAVCPDPVTLVANGANQSVTRTATDRAGNIGSATVSGINIDNDAPDITITGVGGIYTLGAVPTAGCSATDGLSGLAAACKGTTTGGNANGVGAFTYTATATDKAGNTATVSVTYRVKYRWDGFLQPINDTAHQIGTNVSVFKAGSTVPAKFQLKRSDGSLVTAATAPQWLTPVRGSLTTAAVDETLYTDPFTSGSTFRYDATSQQYIYNWGTAKNQANYFWRIGVQLDDGQVYTVSIGLR